MAFVDMYAAYGNYQGLRALGIKDAMGDDCPSDQLDAATGICTGGGPVGPVPLLGEASNPACTVGFYPCGSGCCSVAGTPMTSSQLATLAAAAGMTVPAYVTAYSIPASQMPTGHDTTGPYVRPTTDQGSLIPGISNVMLLGIAAALVVVSMLGGRRR